MVASEVEVGKLPDGARFRSANLDGSYTWGWVIFTNACRARVKLDGHQHQVVFGEGDKRREFDANGASEVNWPTEVMVEHVIDGRLVGSGAEVQDPQEQRWTMNAEAQARAIQARYDHQLKQLEKATADGDSGKVEVIETKISQIEAEAEAVGFKLGEPIPTAAAPAKATPAKKAAPAKATKGAELKAANEERKAALKAKQEAAKAAKPVKEKKAKKLDATHDCLCGCGTETGSRYAPGHDARVKGLLLKIERGDEPKTAIDGKPFAQYVKWAGKAATAGKEGSDFRLVAAPVRVPGRPEITFSEVA